MTKYNIAGYDVEIPESIENYECYMNIMIPYCEDIEKDFNQWYSLQWNCQNVNNNAGAILDKVLNPIINKGIDLLNGYGVYDIDYNIFTSEYLENSLDSFFDTLDEMMLEVDEITHNQAVEKQNRQIRKDSRGRVVGGGFGLGGAIKGMAQAGAINATTGAIHSVGNMIGNAGSAISAGASKSALYDKYRKILEQEIQDAAALTIGAVMRCIQKNTEIRFDYVIDGKSPDVNISKSILNNFKAGRIPDDRQLEQLIKALKNGLNETEVYEVIWGKYGDANGDLRKMADFFRVPLEKRIWAIAETYCKGIYISYSEKHKESINPIQLAVKTESDLRHALEEMQQFCRERDIKESEISYVNKCKEILKDVEIECRTVDGVLYESRGIAIAIQKDKTLFHNFLKNKNLYVNDTFGSLNKIEFQSAYYKEHLRDIYKDEIELRDSSKIFSNLKKILEKYFSGGVQLPWSVEFARIDAGLTQKENIIRNITKMPESEIPVMLISYEPNGKSGILFTNIALRVYSKGLIFGENKYFSYDEIEKIISLGTDTYQIDRNKENDVFKINPGLDDKGQNIFCHFLNEAIFTMKRLKTSELINLKRITMESIRCICGELIPIGDRICPSCFKAYTKEGEFADTIPCRYCGNRIMAGKKFCNKCGKGVLTEETEMVSCPQCGNLIKYGKKFCSRCGTKISVKDGE